MQGNTVRVSLVEWSPCEILVRVRRPASESFLRFTGLEKTWREPPPSMDFAAIALAQYASTLGLDLHVEGPMTHSQARNLERFIEIWSVWRPDLYRRINVKADSWIETPANGSADSAVMAFSGGADATFSLIAHNTGMLSAAMPKIDLGVMVGDPDLSAFDKDGSADAYRKAKETLSCFGAKLAFISTNWKEEFNPHWGNGHVSMLSGILNTFSAEYGSGVIANDADYLEELSVGPYGNHIATNHLLGSSQFSIIQAAGTHARSARIRKICEHDVALRNLWVCYRLAQKGRNCGRCKKCILTRMAIAAYAAEPEFLFDDDFTVSDINEITIGIHGKIYLDDVLAQLPPTNKYYVPLCALRDREAAKFRAAEHQRALDELAVLKARLHRIEHSKVQSMMTHFKNAAGNLRRLAHR